MKSQSIPKYNLELGKKKFVVKLGKVLQNQEKRLGRCPFGVLLSGGLDSSLTSSIASKLVKKEK